MSKELNQSRKIISIKKLADIHQVQEDQIHLGLEELEAQKALKLNELQQQITDLQQQKDQMLTKLRSTIQEEKQAWLETKEQERLEAKESGYESGYRDGVEKAAADWQQKLQEANQLVHVAKDDYYRTIEKHQEAIIRLAIATAEKVIEDKITEDGTYFTNIIEKAIQELKDYAFIEIYVHPSNYDLVTKQKTELEQIVDEKTIISIFADQQLQEGDCMIKHPNGQIDVSIDLQLRQIKTMLAEKVAELS